MSRLYNDKHYDSDSYDLSQSQSHKLKISNPYSSDINDENNGETLSPMSQFMYSDSESDNGEFDPNHYAFTNLLKHNLIKSGRVRKKSSSRRSLEFISKRMKRRLYFCCIAYEIDVNALYDIFGNDSQYMGKLYNDVLYLYQIKEKLKQKSKSFSAPSSSKTNKASTTEESDDSGIKVRFNLVNYDEDDKEDEFPPTERADALWKKSLKEIFVFDFGCIVFWGFSSGEEIQILNEISQAISEGKLSNNELERCEDDMAYIVDPNSIEISIENDMITLPEDSDIKSRLSVSFAIAQSAVLSLFESRVDRKVLEFRNIPRLLAASGRIFIGSKELGNMIGDVFVIRHHLNLNSEIMSTPDIFWHEDENVLIYRMTMKYLEMENRSEVLNIRLNMLIDLLQVLQRQFDNEKGIRLEWIVIFLILVSIALEILSVVSIYLVQKYHIH